jgi:hypothetical protein
VHHRDAIASPTLTKLTPQQFFETISSLTLSEKQQDWTCSESYTNMPLPFPVILEAVLLFII